LPCFHRSGQAQHPSLIDQHHHVHADLFGVINIPSSVWIDERGLNRAYRQKRHPRRHNRRS
jgi:hypothetical protein